MAAVIAVYADWNGLREPLRLGLLHAHRSRGHEVFEFEFDRIALAHRDLANPPLDPRLGFYEGRQHPAQGTETFGVFPDASPDHPSSCYESSKRRASRSSVTKQHRRRGQ